MKTGSERGVRVMVASTVTKGGMRYDCLRYIDNGEIAHCDKHPKHLRPVTRPEDLPVFAPMSELDP